MMSGGARAVWSGVRRSILPGFLSDTVRPAASKTVTMTALNESFGRLRDNSCVIGVQRARTPTAPAPLFRHSNIVELNRNPYDGSVFAEAYQYDV